VGDATNYLAAGIREAIERIEAALKSGASLSNEFLLKGELLNKQGQLAEASQQEVHFEKEKKEEKVRETSSVSYLVEQEQKLNASEKEKYSNFLALEYFGKKDLNELGRFYSDGGGWDKLSEEGKYQMDKRVAEGIRRGQFSIDEMPESMKQRLSSRLENHGIDTGSKQSAGDLEKSENAPHAGKSASSEADSKKTKIGEPDAKEEKTNKDANSDQLAFGGESTVSPLDIRVTSGSTRSPS